MTDQTKAPRGRRMARQTEGTTPPAAAPKKSGPGKQTQSDSKQTPVPAPAAAAPKAKRSTGTRKGGTGGSAGKQTQSAAPAAAAPKAKRSTGTRKGGTGGSPGKQAQSDVAAASMSKQAEQVARGGTLGVPITVAAIPKKPYGKRQPAPEEYPFGALEPATKNGSEIAGPSFFIPNVERADKLIAAARKRHKAAVFWTRKLSETTEQSPKVPVLGVRIWRGVKGVKAPK